MVAVLVLLALAPVPRIWSQQPPPKFQNPPGGVPGGIPGGPPAGSAVLAGPQPVRISGREAKENILERTPAIPPPLAKAAHIEGIVTLWIIIEKDGSVRPGAVISSHPLLMQAALDAVTHWRFKPFLKDGMPIVATTIMKIPAMENPPADFPYLEDDETKAHDEKMDDLLATNQAAIEKARKAREARASQSNQAAPPPSAKANATGSPTNSVPEPVPQLASPRDRNEIPLAPGIALSIPRPPPYTGPELPLACSLFTASDYSAVFGAVPEKPPSSSGRDEWSGGSSCMHRDFLLEVDPVLRGEHNTFQETKDANGASFVPVSGLGDEAYHWFQFLFVRRKNLSFMVYVVNPAFKDDIFSPDYDPKDTRRFDLEKAVAARVLNHL